MNILVTGANGQLGRCLQDLSAERPEWTFFFTDVDTLDICQPDQTEAFVQAHAIDAIINAAAYTAVDRAEDDVEMAYAINRDAVANLANIARRHNAYLVHVSTDYVFSGESCHPYSTEDPIAPISIYGKSKAAGEEAIRPSGCAATIIRTSWLYSEYGHNFVKTMLKLGQERESVSVVCDQIGGPTYAGDLAAVILKAVEVNRNKPDIRLYHFANEGSISWFDFTHAIMEMAGLPCHVEAIFTAEYPAKAPRPAYSVFNLRKIKTEFEWDITYWKESLRLVINKLHSK